MSNQKICQLSPLIVCKSEKYWYIHYLPDLVNNPTQFQLKLFDIAGTLKYGQAKLKWYEQVQLKEY